MSTLAAWWERVQMSRWRKKFPNPDSDPSSIGNILVHLGFVTPAQLREVMSVQKEANDDPEKLMGEILVSTHAVTRDQLLRALDEQQKMRRRSHVTHQDEASRVLDLVRHRARNMGASMDELKRSVDELTKQTK